MLFILLSVLSLNAQTICVQVTTACGSLSGQYASSGGTYYSGDNTIDLDAGDGWYFYSGELGDYPLYNPSLSTTLPTTGWVYYGSSCGTDGAPADVTLNIVECLSVGPCYVVTTNCSNTNIAGTYRDIGQTYNGKPDLYDEDGNDIYWAAGYWYIYNIDDGSLFRNQSNADSPPLTGWVAIAGNICAGSTVTVELNPILTPSVSIAATPGSAITSGTSVTFTATATNGGTTPTYQWKKNGMNVGGNINTYIDGGLVNGDKITCVMTSNASCASPTQVTSNTVIIGIFVPSPSPSFTGLNATYCDIDNAVTLTGNLPGTDGYFTGPGITDNGNGTATFTPSEANIGTNKIRYLSTATNSPGWAQVGGGFYHTVALKNDGTLWAWGENEDGQLGNGTYTRSDIPVQIGTANDWASISVGSYYAFAIKTDGTLWAFGYDGFGSLGIGGVSSNVPVQVGTDNDWASVSADNAVWYAMATKRNGTLWAWGANTYGQLGTGTGALNRPTQVGSATDWASISTGAFHTIALKTDGTLWASGFNGEGQLGDATNNQSNSHKQIGTATDWKKVFAGERQSYAIKADGTLWAWGKNTNGALGIGNNTNSNAPVKVGTSTNWVNGASYLSVIALKADGTIWSWGFNGDGELGNGNNTSTNTPAQVGSATDWSNVGNGPYHTFAIKADGSLLGTGYNNAGQLGIGSVGDKNIFTKVVTATTSATTTVNVCLDFTGLDAAYCKGATAVTLTGNHAPKGTFSGPGIKDNGDGTATFTPAEAGTGGTITYSYSPNAWKSISSGYSNTIGIKSDGSLWGTGENYYGELGNGTEDGSESFIQSGTETNWTNVSQGYYHSLGVKKDGTLWGWGANDYGEIGTGSATDSPVQIGTATNWVTVAAGYYVSLGIKKDGTLWAWGYNGYGELGDGTTDDNDTPTQIGTDNKWASISTDPYGEHVLAVKTDGTLWAWGSGTYGQLGDGSANDIYEPIQVGTATNWASAAAGDYHSIGVKKDGTLWAWGYNGYGELGDGTTDDSNVPKQIGTDNNWSKVSASYQFSLATKTNGTLWAWGDNSYGQLGDGTTDERDAPVQVGTATNWANVEAGAYQSFGLTTDGNLLSWGYNGYGELGIGNTDDQYEPTQVGDVVTVTTFTKNVTVNSIAPTVSVVANPSGTIISGTNVTFTATPTTGGTTPQYQWKKNNNNVGSNSATYSDAGLVSGDIITCVLTSNDPCASPLTATSTPITISVCISPTAYNITGGGTYCLGGTGIAIGLANSQTGVSYQLKKGTTNVGNAVPGTGAAISFGNQTAGGVYTVEATRTAGGCKTTMTGSVTVVEPIAIVFGTPSVTKVKCPGGNTGKVVISATGGAGTITYAISPSVGTQSPSGTFNNLTAQTYTFTATDANGCTKTTSVVVGTNVNTPPIVTLTSPANGATAVTNATLTATASDPDGTISRVNFYWVVGRTKTGVLSRQLLGSDNTAPYSYNWQNVVGGNYDIQAEAVDDCGDVTFSSVSNVNILETFTVLLTSPSSGQSFVPGSNLTLTASVVAFTSRTITKVEFFADNVKLGEDLTAPYTYVWNNVPLGNYYLRAVATDNMGGVWYSPYTYILGINTNGGESRGQFSVPGVAFTQAVGGEFALYQNQPNPAANETSIGFNLPKDGQARLTISTIDGRVVKVINGEYKAGYNSISVNKSDLNTSGIFYYRLETVEHSATKKMVIMN
ncbi:MAG: T9SS type A sorting domain-containing protein [Saprospiraceae bacterium]|nr:T9SS type A sorting domain-containing protein [Saprospiraceae bacterium]